jgi:transposase
MNIATIGIDIAKNVIQVHGVCADGKVTVSRQLRRQQLLPYLQKLAPAWWGWRRALEPTIGHVRL